MLRQFKAAKLDVNGFTESMRELIARSTPLWDDGACRRIADCLGKTAGRLSSSIGDTPADFRSFGGLLRRSTKVDVGQFRNDLCTAAVDLAASDCLRAKDVVRSLLISAVEKQTRVKKPSVILELSDQDRFQ